MQRTSQPVYVCVAIAVGYGAKFLRQPGLRLLAWTYNPSNNSNGDLKVASISWQSSREVSAGAATPTKEDGNSNRRHYKGTAPGLR